MDKSKANTSKAALIIGIIGLVAGIWLIFSENQMIGIFGSIASAGLAIKGYGDLKKNKE